MTRDEIPQWSWYNGQFLFRFDEYMKKGKENVTLKQFLKDFTSESFLPEGIYHTKNQGVVLSLLYTLLVVPREIWEKQTTNLEFRYSDYFETIEGDFKNIHDFLRLFRNSISHANFDIDIKTNRYLFWNQQPNGTVNFKFASTHIKLGDFLTLIGKYYINQVRNSNR